MAAIVWWAGIALGLLGLVAYCFFSVGSIAGRVAVPPTEGPPTYGQIEDAALAVVEASLTYDPEQWDSVPDGKSLALGNTVDWLYNPTADVGLYIEGTRVWVVSGVRDLTMPTGKHIPSFHWQRRIYLAALPIIRRFQNGQQISSLTRIANGFRRGQ